ncbi:Hypothetical predicted protein [Pelobates cultripes]|uniref:Uncharacterized protein n=1 Tax=Pelobates cultripes TaxID=61616 RepID=A0AAD1SWC0_PELCU|nr:Hypothetical predicted protein [Pelobates cultripes]
MAWRAIIPVLELLQHGSKYLFLRIRELNSSDLLIHTISYMVFACRGSKPTCTDSLIRFLKVHFLGVLFMFVMHSGRLWDKHLVPENKCENHTLEKGGASMYAELPMSDFMEYTPFDKVNN